MKNIILFFIFWHFLYRNQKRNLLLHVRLIGMGDFQHLAKMAREIAFLLIFCRGCTGNVIN